MPGEIVRAVTLHKARPRTLQSSHLGNGFGLPGPPPPGGTLALGSNGANVSGKYYFVRNAIMNAIMNNFGMFTKNLKITINNPELAKKRYF